MAARVRAVSFASAVTNVLLVFASVVTNCAAAQGRRRLRPGPPTPGDTNWPPGGRVVHGSRSPRGCIPTTPLDVRAARSPLAPSGSRPAVSPTSSGSFIALRAVDPEVFLRAAVASSSAAEAILKEK